VLSCYLTYFSSWDHKSIFTFYLQNNKKQHKCFNQLLNWFLGPIIHLTSQPQYNYSNITQLPDQKIRPPRLVDGDGT
jgi:hypothetical protein